MRIFTLLLTLFTLTSCTQSPMDPTPLAPLTQQIQWVTYAINIPDRIEVQALLTAHPDGMRLAPISAQRNWDYRSAYGGSPNVYYGPLAPPGGDINSYISVGILVAPVSVAQKDTWTAREWPDEFGRPYGGSPADAVYGWVGRFTYTVAGRREITATIFCTAGRTTICNVAATYMGQPVPLDTIVVAWTWGDGETDLAKGTPLAQHPYEQAGTYGITAVVTARTEDGERTATVRHTVKIL